MVTFCLLVSPLPYAVRKRLFSFLSNSPIIAKIAYGLKISFMYFFFVTPFIPLIASSDLEFRFVAILFADALQRMFRITAESDLAKSNRGGVITDVRSDTNLAAKKF